MRVHSSCENHSLNLHRFYENIPLFYCCCHANNKISPFEQNDELKLKDTSNLNWLSSNDRSHRVLMSSFRTFQLSNRVGFNLKKPCALNTLNCVKSIPQFRMECDLKTISLTFISHWNKINGIKSLRFYMSEAFGFL